MWFGLLGPVEVVIAGQPVALVRAQTRAVLAYLVLHVNHVVSTGELVEALWGGAAPSTAASQVQNAMSSVRSMLRQAAGRDLIVREPAGYRLIVEARQVDLSTFRDLVGAARLQQGATAAATLREALGLWRGRPFSGVNGAFTEPERALLEELHADVWEMLFDIELTLDRQHAVVSELAELSARYPLRQKLIGQLMLALYRCGRQPEALTVYRELRSRLAEEVGTDPGPDLTALHQRILAGDARLSAPEPGSQRQFLPRDLPDFTGRAAELARLDAIAAASGGVSGTVVISAVSGGGGVGKTALAVHWAHRAAGRYPDGQLYVNLRGYDRRSPMPTVEALSALLRELGVAPERVPGELDPAADLYRATLAGKRVLIMLDNARSAEQVRPLLPTGPGSLALVTSRDGLAGLVALDGARLVGLAPMPPDDAVVLLEQIIGTERAEADHEAVADLSVACGHLPLALRIAAANLLVRPEQTVADLVRDLRQGNRIERLAVFGEEHIAVAAVFDQSYAALSTADQRVYRLLGLQPCIDVTAEAVAALAAVSLADAQASLGTLEQASLITETSPGRYQLHDLVKLHAAHMAESVEEQAQRNAALAGLFEFYLDTAASAGKVAAPQTITVTTGSGRIEPTGATAWLRTEQANLVSLVSHCLQHGPVGMAWRLADVLRGYFWLEHDIGAWTATAEDGMADALADGNLSGQAAMHLGMGNLKRIQGHKDETLTHLQRALELARQDDWVAGQAAALNSLGVAYLERGEQSEALVNYQQSAAINEQLGNRSGLAVALVNMGAAHLGLGELHSAAEAMSRALELFEELGNTVLEAITRGHLGLVHIDLGNFAQAQALLERAEQMQEEAGSRINQLGTMLAMADMHMRMGQPAQADRYAQRAITLSDSVDSPRHRATALVIVAQTQRLRGEFARAATTCEEGLAVARSISFRFIEDDALDTLAQIRLSQGDLAGALDLATQALDIAVSDRFQVLVVRGHTTMAEIQLAAGRREEAETHAREAMAISERTGGRQCIARLESVLKGLSAS